jgi:autotransporter-associated beta strand protein
LTWRAANTYTGNTIVNGGTLQLNTGNGGAGALASPAITVNAGGFLALNASDVLGYTTNREALVINDGVVSNITANSRLTIQNAVTMTGGTLTGAGAGDAGGVFSFNTGVNTGVGFVATSDAGGNPAVVNAASIGLQNGNLTIDVSRGPATPPADMIISSNITPFFGSGNGIVKSGDGVLALTGTNTYVGGTTVNNGTLIVASPRAILDGTNLAVGDPTLLSMLAAPVVPSPIATVPEPSTWVLLAAGIGCLAIWRRRK